MAQSAGRKSTRKGEHEETVDRTRNGKKTTMDGRNGEGGFEPLARTVMMEGLRRR